MKKSFAILLALVFVLALSACTHQAGGSVSENDQPTIPSDTTITTLGVTEIAKEDASLSADDKTAAVTKVTPNTSVVVPNGTTVAATKSSAAQISRERAIEIALKDAGFAKADVRDLEAELDREKGVLYWEVEFEVGGRDYSYDIEANSGKIYKEAAVTVALISRDNAIEIALQAANVKKADVRDLEAELDNERKVIVWEIGFEANGYEYSYEIDAASKAILRSERERDD